MEKKKIVVTDPCYIMSSEDWDACCKEAEQRKDEHKQEWEEAFDEIVSRKLTELSGHEAYATSTGFGDWNNDIDGQQFCADSGMVCVCELTDNIREVIDSRFIGMAVFETDKDIEIEFDWSDSDWTVVRIIDKTTGREIVSSQEPYSDDDDYDE